MKAQPKVLILLSASNNPDDRLKQGLVRRFPQLTIHSVAHHSEVGPYIADTNILLTFGALMSDAVLRSGTQMQWIHVLGSGVDGVIGAPALRNDVLVTNSLSLQADPVSEAALALMFALARDIPKLVRHQDQEQWVRFPPMLLAHKTVTIIGVGSIAEALARKCVPLGMAVTGVSAGRTAVPGFTHIYKRAELADGAGKADFLVSLAPASPETMGLVDAKVLAAMKPTSYLVNVGRGGVVDETALIAALERGGIAGAALDVFQAEPLPKGHKLWSMPNVLISPHLGGYHAHFIEALMPLLEHNIRAFLQGDIGAMKNVVRGAA